MSVIFKNVVVYIVNPILLLLLLFLITQALLLERQKMITEEVVIDTWQRGVGAQQPKSLATQWESYYGGGEGLDEVITLNEYSLRISTGGDGGWYGARSNIDSNVSLANNSISFAVYADDWQSLDRLMVLFGTNDGFTDYFGLNLKNYFSNPTNREWIEVVLERSAFEAIEGAPDWRNVSDIAVRVVPKPAVSTRVWLDEFKVVPETASAPIISFTFDDGFASVVDAASILNTYSYVGTAYVTPRLLDTTGYMSQDNLDALHEQGWDISGHSDFNLTELMPSDVDTELAQMLEFLKEKNYTGSQHFAYPNGAYNQSVKSQVREYFNSARTIDGFSQPTEYAYPQNINAVTISSSTPVSAIAKEIEQARKDNSWLILVWHDFSASPASDVEYNMDDFRWLVSYIHSLEIEVQPYSVAYSRFYE